MFKGPLQQFSERETEKKKHTKDNIILWETHIIQGKEKGGLHKMITTKKQIKDGKKEGREGKGMEEIKERREMTQKSEEEHEKTSWWGVQR